MANSYEELARYNQWMNRRIYAICGALSDADRTRDRGAFFSSVHGTLNHVLLADRAWMARFTQDRERFCSRDSSGAVIAIESLGQIIYQDVEDLTRERDRTDVDILEWTRTLSPERLEGTLRYRTSAGKEYDHPLRWAVAHLFNHQTHHRGQVTTLLSQLGIDPGVTDLVFFLRGDVADDS